MSAEIPSPSERPVLPIAAGRFFENVGALSAARIASMTLQVVVLAIAARTLTLQDFAHVAMAMVVPVFAAMMSDAGLMLSLIRTRTVDQTEWSTVFWALFVTGLVLAGLVLAAAPASAWFFGAPEVAPLVTATALIPLAQALSCPSQALLQRAERFRLVAGCEVAASILAALAAVLMMFDGWGASALIWQQILLPVIRLILYAVFARWWPSLRFSWSLLRGHVRFGRDVLGVAWIGMLEREGAVIAIGKLAGDAPLALWSMSDRLARLPSTGVAAPLASVVYPRMTRRRDEPAAIARLHLAAMRPMCLILIPLVIMIAAAGEAVLSLFATDAWAPAGLVFAALAPSLLIEMSHWTLYAGLNASGRSALRLRIGAEHLALWLAALVLTAPYGAVAVAAVRSLVAVVYLPRLIMLARRVLPLSLCALAGAFAVPAGFSLAAASLHLVLREGFALGKHEELAVATALGVVAWVASVAVQRHALRDDVRLLRNDMDTAS